MLYPNDGYRDFVMNNQHTAETVAKLFGVPVDNVRKQYRDNAVELREMISTGDLRGSTQEQLAKYADHAETQSSNTSAALYVRRGRTLYSVTPDEASYLGTRLADTSESERLELCDSNGKQIAWVSANGRVWLGTIHNTDLEIPTQGRKTADQRELEGWK